MKVMINKNDYYHYSIYDLHPIKKSNFILVLHYKYNFWNPIITWIKNTSKVIGADPTEAPPGGDGVVGVHVEEVGSVEEELTVDDVELVVSSRSVLSFGTMSHFVTLRISCWSSLHTFWWRLIWTHCFTFSKSSENKETRWYVSS